MQSLLWFLATASNHSSLSVTVMHCVLGNEWEKLLVIHNKALIKCFVMEKDISKSCKVAFSSFA